MNASLFGVVLGVSVSYRIVSVCAQMSFFYFVILDFLYKITEKKEFGNIKKKKKRINSYLFNLSRSFERFSLVYYLRKFIYVENNLNFVNVITIDFNERPCYTSATWYGWHVKKWQPRSVEDLSWRQNQAGRLVLNGFFFYRPMFSNEVLLLNIKCMVFNFFFFHLFIENVVEFLKGKVFEIFYLFKNL